MQYIMNFSDQQRQHMVVFTLRETDVKRPAVDFFFDVVASPADQLAEDGIIPHGQKDDLVALQELMFGQDADGVFIRDEVQVTANSKPLNPDEPFRNAFVEAERETAYMHCDVLVGAENAPAAALGGGDVNIAQRRLDELARIWFLWQIGNGYLIDVTKEIPELAESIAEAERKEWIDIDVKKAAYRLTPEGQRMLQNYKDEAQELIRRYDIYGDVDVDYDGSARFDTGLGKDLRIPIFELEGVDPYRARFLIGLNDGEFNQFDSWPDIYRSQETYEKLLADVGYAPSLEDIGRDKLMRIVSAGKAQLRSDPRLS